MHKSDPKANLAPRPWAIFLMMGHMVWVSFMSFKRLFFQAQTLVSIMQILFFVSLARKVLTIIVFVFKQYF